MGDKSSNKKNTYISYSYVKLPEGKYNIMQSLLLLHRKNTVSGKDAEFWDDFFPISGWYMKLGAAQAASGGLNQRV